jgi:hypothetical protein
MARVFLVHGANADIARMRRAELEDELLCRLTGAEIADAVRDALRQRPRATAL